MVGGGGKTMPCALCPPPPELHVVIFFFCCLSVQLSFLEVNLVCLLHNIDLSGVCALADILATIPLFMLPFKMGQVWL